MSKQIAVRLPDDIVDFIDQLVDNGQASNRAVVVARAIDRERRRAVAARDAAILAPLGTDPDLDSLAEHAARTPLVYQVSWIGRSSRIGYPLWTALRVPMLRHSP